MIISKQFLLIICLILIILLSETQNLSESSSITNCSYENTIDISGYSKFPNASYTNDNVTIIPPNLVRSFDYDIIYDGSKVSVPKHNRGCICHLSNCISLCSNNILKLYEEFSNKNEMANFDIDLTLKNGSRIKKNIVKDFQHRILTRFCKNRYFLYADIFKYDRWSLFENGTLLYQYFGLYLMKNEYCFEGQTKMRPMLCMRKYNLTIINKWSQTFSIPFFVLTIIAYCCLPELRNVHGKCFISHLSCLTLSYSLSTSNYFVQFKFIEDGPCMLIGFLNYYLQIAYYAWLGIISYDTCQTFRDITYTSTYRKYFFYGWIIPLLLTILTYFAEMSHIPVDPEIYKSCSLNVQKWSAFIFLYGPCSIVLIFCLIGFIWTSRIIKQIDNDTMNLQQMTTSKIRYSLYLRLFLMMGVSWSLDIISFLLTVGNSPKFLPKLIDLINTIQILYTCLHFIGRSRVRSILREKFTLQKKSLSSEEMNTMESN